MTAEPIVVGVDGSPDAQRAVDWALSWSAAVGAPVAVIAAEPVPPGRSPNSPGFGDRAQAIIDEELARLRESAPTVTVEGSIAVSHPVTALVNASRTAGAVVVGTKGTGGWRGSIVGTVSGNVAASAHSPTVVLPSAAPAVFDLSGPIVVGTDGSEASVNAAKLAVEAAAAEGRAVRLVQAERGTTSPEEPLDWVVEELRALQPDVEVELLTVEGRASDVLGEQSAQAAFVVVASHGHRGVPGFLLGTTARGLVQTAQAPVIILTGRSQKLWPVTTRD